MVKNKEPNIKLVIDISDGHMYQILDAEDNIIARAFKHGDNYFTCEINKDYFKNLYGDFNQNLAKFGNMGTGNTVKKSVENCFNLYFENVTVV